MKRRFFSWWKKSFRIKLLLSVLVTILSFFLLFGLLAIKIGQQGIRTEVQKRNSILARILAAEVKEEMDNISNRLPAVSLIGKHPEDELVSLVSELVRLRLDYPLTYRAFYLFDADGRVLVHLADTVQELNSIKNLARIIERPSIEVELEVMEAFENSGDAHRFISSLRLKELDQVPVLYIGMPIRGGRLKRVLVGEIDLRFLWLKTDNIVVGLSGQAMIVSSNDLIIAHPDRSYIGRHVEPALQSGLTGYEGAIEYLEPESGEVKLASYSPVGKPYGLTVFVEQNREEAFAHLKKIQAYMNFLLATALGVATMLSMLVTNRVVRSLHRLVKTSNIITSTGDLHHNVPVVGEDEVGELSKSFNRMLESLRQADQDIRALNETLEERVHRRTQELESANEEMKSFAYSISHDLRSPLRGISGWAQALKEEYIESLDEQGRVYLERVLSETKRMGQLIDDLLKLSRVSRAEMVREEVDISKMVNDTAERLNKIDPGRRVELTIQPGLKAIGDRNLLEVLLSNLLENAWKFTRDHSPARIEFGQTIIDEKPAFFVRDNGVGFDMQYAGKLFGAFQRMHKASEFPGTGIGLSIVQRIVHRHGGRVWADAEVDRGATFYFTLQEET